MNDDVFEDKWGNIYLVRCPICGYENYAINVSTGTCTFCGFDANKEQNNGKRNITKINTNIEQGRV